MTNPLGPTDPQLPPRTDEAVFAEGSYDRLIEPRSDARLALDGSWHQVAKNYLRVQFITNGALLLFIAAVTLVLVFVAHQPWAWIAGGILFALQAITVAILPRQARAYGFMLREDDIVFRRGIMWQRMVAVPYGRMQLVDVTHGPLDRAFGIAQLKLVTAAATTGATIPGLTQAAAERLRDTLIEVSESRRTGL